MKSLARVILVYGMLSLAYQKGCDGPIPGQQVTAVTYVYEKDQTAPPAAVQAGLAKLNKRGIVASMFEEDVTDNEGNVPEQYVVPLKAAQEAGLPALVATAGDSVVEVVKAPVTEEQVLEAAE